MPIVFTRQSDGSYVESGDFQIGTRTVGLWINGQRAIGNLEHNAKERLSMLRESLGRGPVTAKTYELREIRVDPAELVERRTAQLVKARARKTTEEAETIDVIHD